MLLSELFRKEYLKTDEALRLDVPVQITNVQSEVEARFFLEVDDGVWSATVAPDRILFEIAPTFGFGSKA